MSQESINHMLRRGRLSDGVIDVAYLQDIEKLPEYSRLSLEEKNALALMDSNSISAFLSSAAVRRDNAADDNRVS
jgi:hypothetical protein